MALFAELIRAINLPHHLAFLRACRDPAAAERTLWREIAGEARNGLFWRSRLRTSLDEHPITDYETYRPAIEAAYRGAAKICPLTGREIIYWVETSGTATGEPKLYPLTDEYRRGLRRSVGPIWYSLATRHRGFLDKPILYFAPTLPAKRSPSGHEVAAIAAFHLLNVPPVMANRYAFPQAVFRDRDTFFRWGPLYALSTDLSAMLAITPAVVEQFARSIETHIESYWPHLEGRAASPPAPGLPRVRCDPARAAELRRLITPGGAFSFQAVWPSLEFITCWKAGVCALQLPRLDRWCRATTMIDASYVGSEGWFTAPLWDDRTGGPLDSRLAISEFFPAGDEPSDAALLKPWQLSPGRDYEIVITTRRGLIRSRLHDVVRCTGFFHRSPILEFVEKAGNTMSLGHTRVHESQVIDALSRAAIDFAGPWVLAPTTAADGLLFCHREAMPDLRARLDAFDRELQKTCPDYARNRDKLLRPIEPLHLPRHTLWDQPQSMQSKQKVVLHRPPEPT
jgi:hypothetical protein